MSGMFEHLLEGFAKILLRGLEAVMYDAQLAVQTFVSESFETVERTLQVGGESPTGTGTLAVCYLVAGAVAVFVSLKRLR